MAAADLDRLDAEIAALAARCPGVDLHEVRGVRTREAARDKALRTLCRLKAQGAPGLEAKARALRSRELKPDHARFGALSASLAADLDRLGALGKVAAPAPEPAAPEPPVAAASDDSALLALAPELEAAASAYLRARDHAVDLAPSDPDHDAAMAHNRALHSSLEAVTDRIFAHRPTTLAGVLLTAHAAAAMAQEGWDEAPEHVHGDGRLLRSVCDGLFRLVGVDWRGRPAGDGVASTPAEAPASALTPDPVFAAIEASRAARAAKQHASAMPAVETPAGEGQLNDAIDAEGEAWSRLLATPPTTIAGALALARFKADFIGEGIWDYTEDASVLFRAIGAVEPTPGSNPAPAVDGTTLIPLAEAAIAEQRAAAAVSEATGHDAPPGTFARSMHLLERVTAVEATTPEDLAAKARVLLAHARSPEDLDGDWRCQTLALAIARDTARLGAAPPAAATGEAQPDPDPVFAAIGAHRSAHGDWLASLGGQVGADEEPMARKKTAFEALLDTRPRTEAGRLAWLEQVVFEFGDIARGCLIPEDWARAAGRMVNGGQPITDATMPPVAIEPVAADRALHAAIEAHFMAYGARLYSEAYGEGDAADRAEQERAAFREVLHTCIETDAGRIAYATAVLARAIGAHADECQGEGRTAPLAVAYRNLAHGQFWPEDEAPLPMAAE